MEYWEAVWSEHQASYPTENINPGELYSTACFEFKKGLLILLHLCQVENPQSLLSFTNAKSIREILTSITNRTKEENNKAANNRLKIAESECTHFRAKLTPLDKKDLEEKSENPHDGKIELSHEPAVPLKAPNPNDHTLYLRRDHHHNLLYVTNMQRMLDVIIDAGKRMNWEDAGHAAVINRGVDHWDREFGRLCSERIMDPLKRVFGELENQRRSFTFLAFTDNTAVRLLQILSVADVLLSDDELPGGFAFVNYGFPPDHVWLSDELSLDFGTNVSE
jgi:hypothetical protein